MTAVAKYNNLAKLPNRSEQQLKALAQAVDLELALPGMYLDLHGGKSANSPIVTLIKQAPASPERPLWSQDSIKAALRAKYATPADTPISSDVAARIDQWFHTGMQDLDTGWTNLYRLVDMRGGNQDTFEIVSGSFGITFKQRAPGEKTEIWRLPQETEVPVKFVTYSAGAGVLDDWLRYNKWWKVEEIITEFRAKSWMHQAEQHYGLITSLGTGINFPHIAGDDLGTETLNAAAAYIYRSQLTSGTGVSASTPLWIITSPEKRGYILRMLEATQGSLIIGYQNGIPLAVTVAGVIATTYVAADDAGYYLVLPQRKVARGVWLDLQIEKERDIYKRAQDWVGTMQYNAAVADATQVRRVLFPA
ncbi:hypothetical protein [Stenotrophomonas sp. MMGLT7]|uniref:hypothetical protein n=1 Tax=Stenotrophomonas sp. MMGLT7 TaxID=2901227 RepID=UPI001E526D5F|nr:hypothetical protein [Stenotrophomonas sp. MMGLT7]MCD7096941.1 hypothetical protein [Stenotrophomonas sp. MMGLT7]